MRPVHRPPLLRPLRGPLGGQEHRIEPVAHGLRGRRTPGRVLLQTRHDQLLESRRHRLLDPLRGPPRLRLDVLRHHLQGVLPLEHQHAREEPVGHAAHRVHVHPVIGRGAEHDLRRHEAGGAAPAVVGAELHQVPVGVPGGVELDQAEVEHLDEVVRRAGPADHDVRRLDVAVDQAVRVRVLQRGADLAQDMDDPLRRQRPGCRTRVSRSSPSSSSIT